MEIDGIKVCKPIEDLINLLSEYNFKVINKKISDYHFHEVTVLMEGKDVLDISVINTDKINKISNSEFTCECHWSTIKINIIP